MNNLSQNYNAKNWKDWSDDTYVIILFYEYVKVEDTKNLMDRERAVWEVLDLKGRLLIAAEGINGTLEGKKKDVDKYIGHILGDKRFKRMIIKKSLGTALGTAFPKIKIKVRDEIVGEKLFKINPKHKTGVHLQPHELKKWYENDEDFVIVDMRNDYELDSGYFEKTINVEADFKLSNSRDLDEVIDKSKLKIWKDKKVVTVCTGGVRCEKMSALLLEKGFKDVYQLHNGMHGYMEKYPGENFKGTLFTFDNRLVMDFGNDINGKREVIGRCIVCEGESENYTNCANNARVNQEFKNKKLCNRKIIVCVECIDKNKLEINKEKEEILCRDCRVS